MSSASNCWQRRTQVEVDANKAAGFSERDRLAQRCKRLMLTACCLLEQRLQCQCFKLAADAMGRGRIAGICSRTWSARCRLAAVSCANRIRTRVIGGAKNQGMGAGLNSARCAHSIASARRPCRSASSA